MFQSMTASHLTLASLLSFSYLFHYVSEDDCIPPYSDYGGLGCYSITVSVGFGDAQSACGAIGGILYIAETSKDFLAMRAYFATGGEELCRTCT